MSAACLEWRKESGRGEACTVLALGGSGGAGGVGGEAQHLLSAPPPFPVNPQGKCDAPSGTKEKIIPPRDKATCPGPGQVSAAPTAAPKGSEMGLSFCPLPKAPPAPSRLGRE